MIYLTAYLRKSAPKTIRTVVDFQDYLLASKTKNLENKVKTSVFTSTTLQKNTEAQLSRIRLDLDIYNRRYKEETKDSNFDVFSIPKASGGMRKITAPKDLLKQAYHNVAVGLKHSLRLLEHESAYAYKEKTSTLSAIKKHQENNSQWFLKVDLENFFGSCTEEVIITQLNKVHPFNHSPVLVKALAEFATYKNELPQGTPLSPSLTNYLMIPFDYNFNEWCVKNGFIYTRYADDLIISCKTSFKFSTVIEKIKSVLKKEDYPFFINEKKVRYGSRSGQNWNLGLMLNKDNQITLGHRFKQNMKTILFKLAHEELPKNSPEIIGLLSYLKQIEPTYFEYLNHYCIRKYRLPIKSLTRE
jgi:RNA-directed DNA polymerase